MAKGVIILDVNFWGSSSAGNCGIVSDGKTTIMLDAGLPFRTIQQALDFNLAIDGVLLTHSHGDHSKAIKDLIKRGIDCYMAEETAQEIKASGHPWANVIKPLEQFKIGSFTVLPFDVKHDVTNTGYLITSGREKAIYIVDTPYCKYKFDGLTTIMMEINYCKEILDSNVKLGLLHPSLRNRIVGSHFGLDTALDFLAANDISQVRQIYVVHLSNGNSDEALIKDTLQRKTGKEIIIVGE